MRHPNPAIKAMVFAAALFASVAAADGISVNTSGAVNDCSDVSFRFDGGQAVAAEQRLQIGGNALALRLGQSKGVPLKVVGSDRGGYELLLCKGADTASTLAGVRIEQRGTEVSVVGPGDGRWGGYLVVRAPRNAELDVEANNGPVSIDSIAGRLAMRTANGPVSLKNVGGSVTVDSKNGPLSFKGRAGDVKLTAQNGPMSIRLEGATWEGGEFLASTRNGPLSLKVPERYASGITVDRGSHAPFRCPVALCGERPRNMDDRNETVEIGSGPRRVKLSSQNGPVTISETRD